MMKKIPDFFFFFPFGHCGPKTSHVSKECRELNCWALYQLKLLTDKQIAFSRLLMLYQDPHLDDSHPHTPAKISS